MPGSNRNSELENNEMTTEVGNDLESEAEITVVTDDLSRTALIYKVKENPPFHITAFCALQQGLLTLSNQLVVSLLVAEAVCASDNDVFKARLLSSTLFMSGITTIAMNLVGTRLPLFQAATASYVLPLVLISNVEGQFCSGEAQDTVTSSINDSAIGINNTSAAGILDNVRALQGSLMIAGLIQALIGFTGLIGFFLRYVGPLTIVPAMILMFVFIIKPLLKFVEASWGISMSTVAVAIILSLYMAKYRMPIPTWTPSGGFRIIRYPFHQIFAILLSILFNWLLCWVFTATGVFTDDPKHIQYNARTDARASVLSENPWLTVPYPGQYGPFGFSLAAFVAFLIATMLSVLASVGDYYACAKVCRVPAPPPHAVNRGILVEGICSFLAGAVGCGHATSASGASIGSIGVTKVASRQVFLFTGILYVLFGVFGKFSAVFITIPYPVLGGAVAVIFGIFFGVIISNLEVTKMSSPRNVAILGLSVFIGLLIPTWVKKVKDPVNTGHEVMDRVIAMLLGNPNFIGTVLAFFLDNTVPGTREERGIAAWQAGENEDFSRLDPRLYEEGYDIYSPLIPKRVLRWRFVKYIPFLPYLQTRGKPTELKSF